MERPFALPGEYIEWAVHRIGGDKRVSSSDVMWSETMREWVPIGIRAMLVSIDDTRYSWFFDGRLYSALLTDGDTGSSLQVPMNAHPRVYIESDSMHDLLENSMNDPFREPYVPKYRTVIVPFEKFTSQYGPGRKPSATVAETIAKNILPGERVVSVYTVMIEEDRQHWPCYIQHEILFELQL